MISPRLALGVMLSLCFVGCEKDNTGYNTVKPTSIVPNTAPPKHHPDHGPNGGHIFELGEFHAEVAMDKDRKLTIYLLDEKQKDAKPVENGTLQIVTKVDDKETTLDLAAAPLDVEKDGKCSRFELAADKVPGAVMNIEQLTGNLVLNAGGKTLTQSLTDEHHHEEGHDHDHEHEGHDHPEAAPEKK